MRGIKKFYGIQKLDRVLENVTSPLCKKFGFINYKIISNWPDIVGEKLANMCAPTKISFMKDKSIDGTLFIEVANPGFALSIQTNESIILDRIAIYFGYKAVSKIKINISNFKQSKKEVEELPTPQAITPPISAILEKVDDEKTKNILEDISRYLKI